MRTESQINNVEIYNQNSNNFDKQNINKNIRQKIIYHDEGNDLSLSKFKLVSNPNNNINNKEVNSKKKERINNNIKFRNKIEDILFSQLSDINVQLLNLGEESNTNTKISSPNKKMILPKIDTIQLTLLKPDVSITDFIKYGYGIYFFFYYLKSLLITFGVLLIFAIYYICIIFFKYYRDYEDEYSLFFDYNLLSLVSGVQIIKFRKYFIETHGKEEFLEKHKNFDVFYREHFIVGNGLFGVVIIINFIFLFISLRKYHGFKNKDITNYNTLIFSGDDNPEIIEEKAKKEEIKDTNIKKKKILSEKEITDKIGVDNVEIQYTIKKSDYYKKMDKLNKLSDKNDVVLYRINKKKCCPHKLGSFTCCCLCRCCFDCCGVKNKLDTENEKLTGQINKIENELKEMDEKEEDIKINELEEQKNQLYLLTFHNIQDL